MENYNEIKFCQYFLICLFFVKSFGTEMVATTMNSVVVFAIAKCRPILVTTCSSGNSYVQLVSYTLFCICRKHVSHDRGNAICAARIFLRFASINTIALIASAIRIIKPQPVTAESGYGRVITWETYINNRNNRRVFSPIRNDFYAAHYFLDV